LAGDCYLPSLLGTRLRDLLVSEAAWTTKMEVLKLSGLEMITIEGDERIEPWLRESRLGSCNINVQTH